MLHGLLNLSFWGYVVATLLLTHITIASITIYLHRCQAHRALDLHPIVSHFFRYWLWLTTGMQTKQWAAIHRKHHARCETTEDPHSPQILGLKKVLWEGAELYRQAKSDQETMERYGYGTPDDWIERRLYIPYSSYGVFVMMAIDLLLFGIPGITVWAIQMMWTPFFAAGIINGVGHYWGYRNFECPDAARNIIPWGILIGGEELHNNHHTYGTSAKLSVKWWEFDLGWCYIRLLQSVGLATVKKTIPRFYSVPEKKHIDLDTVKTIITNRFQIMAQYTQDVILPILQEEKHKTSKAGRAVLQRAKMFLVKADQLLDQEGKKYIESALQDNHVLQQVYQYRVRLQEIWTRTAASHRDLVEALQEWCKQAEETGIEALHQFATTLRSLSSTPSIAAELASQA